MRPVLEFARSVLPPLAGVVFTGLWVLAAANTISEDRPAEWIPYALIGLSIALVRVWPLVALLLIAVAVVLQLLIPGWRFEETNAAAYLGVVIVIAVVAASASRRRRLDALALSVITGPVVGWMASVRPSGESADGDC